ncbi:MAG: SpoIIE family protein phosphatase, partial [Candidatus Eremiobacteraeota bacterium]|nr:SpoIIE family protein phosphatase [Candidatus Eremiobacteraeota bacterium]
DPAKLKTLETLVHQRLFIPDMERRLLGQLRHHRTVVTDMEPEALRGGVQPSFAHVYGALSPHSAVVAPLYVGETLFGAVIAYASDSQRRYTEADREMFAEIARRASLRLEHERSFQRERHLARTLQEATLPVQLPSIAGALLSTAYFPATTELLVGGDWYDAFELIDGRYLLTIGDVTGHGLQASVVMAKLRHYLNVIAMYEPDPARVLDAAERILLQRYPDVIATAFLVILDPREQRISFANAGHPPPLLRLRDGSIVPLEADGLPVGLRRMSHPAASASRSIEDVALLAFYTDGLIEATRDLEQGERRLRTAVSKEAILFTRGAASYIATSCLPAKSHDDVALVVLSLPRSVVWTFDADDAGSAQRARKEFIAQLREDASADSDFAAAELIFGELVGNVVRHAPGAIDIALEWRDGLALLHVIDRGPGFSAKHALRVDPMSEDGRGLWLVHLLGKGLRVERLPYFGNHVRVALPVRPKQETPRAGGVPETVHREGLEPPTN